jgi:hypothetical protein
MIGVQIEIRDPRFAIPNLQRAANAWLALTTTALLAWLFIISDPLDVLGETFFLTHFLEAAEHLLCRFTATHLNLNHVSLSDRFVAVARLCHEHF